MKFVSKGMAALPACVAVALLLSGCLGNDADPSPEGEVFDPGLSADWPALEWPKDNPYSAAKASLGQELFFDLNLSRDGTASCAWCHSPFSAYSDNHNTPFSTGVRHQLAHRNTPTLANVAFSRTLMLDGSAATLEEQALLPLLSETEMDMTEPEILARLSADTVYAALFRQAYGDTSITLDRVVKALATWQRTLVSSRSYYDRWQAGDEGAMAPEAVRGAALFFSSRTDCSRCHTPPLFTDDGFHNTGLDSMPEDKGRALVTGLAADEGRFKTPTLRNIARTSPYMHDGRFYTLAAVLEHYNTGGKATQGADSLVRPLGLTSDEMADLQAFLESLSDPEFPVSTGP
jgi:cytochrome c peroxidase